MNTVTHAYTHGHTHTRTDRHTHSETHSYERETHGQRIQRYSTYTDANRYTRTHKRARAYTFRNEVYSLSAVFHIVR